MEELAVSVGTAAGTETLVLGWRARWFDAALLFYHTVYAATEGGADKKQRLSKVVAAFSKQFWFRRKKLAK